MCSDGTTCGSNDGAARARFGHADNLATGFGRVDPRCGDRMAHLCSSAKIRLASSCAAPDRESGITRVRCGRGGVGAENASHHSDPTRSNAASAGHPVVGIGEGFADRRCRTGRRVPGRDCLLPSALGRGAASGANRECGDCGVGQRRAGNRWPFPGASLPYSRSPIGGRHAEGPAQDTRIARLDSRLCHP